MDQSDISFIKSVYLIKNPTTAEIISPVRLSEKVITFLSKVIVNKAKFLSWHTSARCLNKDCFQCKTLLVVSTVATILDVHVAEQLKTNSTTAGDEECENKLVNIDSQVVESSLDQEVVKKESKQQSSWYEQTLRCLHENEICLLLVPFLQCDCHFISFTVRKILVEGMSCGIFKVSNILDALNNLLTKTSQKSGQLIDFLTLIISDKRSKQETNSTTIEWILENRLKLEVKMDMSPSSSGEVYDSVRLWSYLFKYISRSELTTEISESNLEFFQNQIKLLSKSWDIEPADHGCLLCVQYLKFVSSVFSVLDDFPNIVYKVSHVILEYSSTFFSKGFKNNLFKTTDFIGKQIKDEEVCTMYASSLVKRLTLVILKATTIKLQVDQDISTILQALQSLLCNLAIYQKMSANLLPNSDWLTPIFADQDDKWIWSLFWLLKIWRFIKGYSIQNDEDKVQMVNQPVCNKDDSQTTTKAAYDLDSLQTKEPSASSLDINKVLDTISPHKLFIQFSNYINYDHLVIADFLSSSETRFLQYFLSYLHELENDWDGFQKVCETLDQDIALEESNIFYVKNKSSPFTNSQQVHFNSYKRHRLSFVSDHPTTCISKNSNNIPHKKMRFSSCENIYENKDHPATSCNDPTSLVVYSDSDSSSCSNDFDTDENEHFVIKDRLLDESVASEPLSSESDSSLHSMHQEIIKDRVMSFLIRLRFHIQRLSDNDLFPFNIKPLLKQLKACEYCYDNIE